MDTTKTVPTKPPRLSSPSGTGPAITGLTRDKTASAKQLPGGEDRRRSQRVLLRVRVQVHVTLQGKPTTHDVITLNVNAHGALVAMKQHLPTGTRVVLEHSATKERIACKVVRPPSETPEGFHTALEFESAAPGFWKIVFPPANWRPEDP
jgi:hypothetical protein